MNLVVKEILLFASNVLRRSVYDDAYDGIIWSEW
jgi:hypothetical protein